VDGLFPDNEYRRQKHALETELESLIIPEVDAATEAGRLITQLPDLWQEATLAERHELLVQMLDGVYVDLKGCKSVIAIKPKAPFRAVLQVASTRAGSGVSLMRKEPSQASWNGSENQHMCSWWRRGRVELPVQKVFQQASTSVSGDRFSL
jgi:site-specific DNA recombinase